MSGRNFQTKRTFLLRSDFHIRQYFFKIISTNAKALLNPHRNIRDLAVEIKNVQLVSH